MESNKSKVEIILIQNKYNIEDETRMKRNKNSFYLYNRTTYIYKDLIFCMYVNTTILY